MFDLRVTRLFLDLTCMHAVVVGTCLVKMSLVWGWWCWSGQHWTRAYGNASGRRRSRRACLVECGQEASRCSGLAPGGDQASVNVSYFFLLSNWDLKDMKSLLSVIGNTWWWCSIGSCNDSSLNIETFPGSELYGTFSCAQYPGAIIAFLSQRPNSTWNFVRAQMDREQWNIECPTQCRRNQSWMFS